MKMWLWTLFTLWLPLSETLHATVQLFRSIPTFNGYLKACWIEN